MSRYQRLLDGRGLTIGTMADVLEVLARAGITWADDDPTRKSDALVALTEMVEAIAAPKVEP